MKKNIFNRVVIFGVICMFTIVPINTYGTENTTSEVVEDCAEEIVYPVMRASCLSVGTAKITKLSSNSINVYGITQCYKKCDNVYLSLFLEKKVNGSYGTYKYWDYSTTDATKLSKSLIVSVPSGYYYRLRAYHAASDDGSDKESLSNLTEGIYVG